MNTNTITQVSKSLGISSRMLEANTLIKKEFKGGWLDQEHMCDLLDEHLNYYSHIHFENTEPENTQIALLIPVREK